MGEIILVRTFIQRLVQPSQFLQDRGGMILFKFRFPLEQSLVPFSSV